MIIEMLVLENGTSRRLCQLDILKFSEAQVRNRMQERGIKEENCLIVGFLDWGCKRDMTLRQAYSLRRSFLELYDGDDYVLKCMLRRYQRYSINEIIASYYRFEDKDEVEAVIKILGNMDSELLLRAFASGGTWVNFFVSLQDLGYLLVTPRGVYRRMFVE